MKNMTKVIYTNSQINGKWGPENICNEDDVTQLDKCQDIKIECICADSIYCFY